MNTFLWIIQAALAVAFAMAGIMKLAQPKEKLAANMGWVEEYSANAVKGIGVAEILAVIGLIVPPLVDVAPILTPLASIGLLIVMFLAAMLHRRRGETQMIVVNVVLGLLALVVVWGRLGPVPF